MRAFIALVGFVAVLDSSLAATQDKIDKEWAADRVREALRERTPILGSPRAVVVPSATVAEGIHAAVVRGVFGDTTVREQRPFHAVRSGDYWVVHGSLPGVSPAEQQSQSFEQETAQCSGCFMSNRSHQALERTATRCAFTFCVAKTFSFRATRARGGADLVVVRQCTTQPSRR